MLSPACHEATIMHFYKVNHRGKELVTLEYAKDLGTNYLKIDTIKYVPSGTKGAAATVTVLPAVQKPFHKPREPVEQIAPEVLDMTPPDAVVASSPGTPVPTIPKDVSLVGSTSVPQGFGSMNAAAIVGIEVPNHIKARWQIRDPKMRVHNLFHDGVHASKQLDGVELKFLKEFTGETVYGKVPSKTHDKSAPRMGLTELFVHLKIKGRSMRANVKGMQFFFLACTRPQDIVWPAFQSTGKRQRAATFSLVEQGRLVGILKDPQNMDLTTMLMKKWSRADLDAKSGDKGVEQFWTQLAVIFNDDTYFPDPCKDFANYVESLDDGYVYATNLVPAYRTGDCLKTQWSKLRKAYAEFYARYDRSGQNGADPTEFSKDLPTLLMHFTFSKTTLLAWAAKRAGAQVDDAGDGSATETSVVRKRKRTRKGSTSLRGGDSHQRLIAGAALYETLHTVMAHCKDEDELKAHEERVRRVNHIMDMCLSEFENSVE